MKNPEVQPHGRRQLRQQCIGWMLGLILAGVGGYAQQPAVSAAEAPPAPRWLLKSAWRGRAGLQVWRREEEPAQRSPYLMHRFRGSIGYRGASWWSANLEFQDARTFDADPAEGLLAFHDPLDIRLATVRFGVAEGDGWSVVAGRQEISLGQERLLGSDAEWCNIGRTFDGVLARWRKGAYAVEALLSKSVRTNPTGLDRAWDGQRVNYWKLSWAPFGSKFELSPTVIDTMAPDGEDGSRRLLTGGFAWQANLPRGGLWEGEAHWQRGPRTSASAFAFSVNQPVPWTKGEPALGAGLMWASGGGTDGRGVVHTFHDLYPAGHNSAGLLDPFAWRNIVDLLASYSWKTGQRWSVTCEDHTYWLASRQDGLYVDGGPAQWFASEQDSRYAGHQVNLLFQRPWQGHTVAFGVGWLHTAPFVQRGGGASDAAVLFASWDVSRSKVR